MYVCLSALANIVRPHGADGSMPDLSQRSQVRYPGQAAFISPSTDSRRAVVSYWQKYVHTVLVNYFGGLSLPRKSVFRLTDSLDLTIAVYRGCKATIQHLANLASKRRPLLTIKFGIRDQV